MALLRDIQKDTGGFTEFVPLSLIHQEAPMYRRSLVPGVRPGATGVEVVAHARARAPHARAARFRNIQCSWVKEGPKLAQMLLAVGRQRPRRHAHQRDRSRPRPGAGHGQLVPPGELRRLVRDLGRVPAQRSTTYGILKLYADGNDDDTSPLDTVEDAEAQFGSYRRLTASSQFRFAKLKPPGAGRDGTELTGTAGRLGECSETPQPPVRGGVTTTP